MEEIFDSCVRPAGDLAGVFEHDGETGYFYLYATASETGQKVVDSIHVVSGESGLAETDVSVRWDVSEEKVGLFIKGVLWAAFDSGNRTRYASRYVPGGAPSLPAHVRIGF